MLVYRAAWQDLKKAIREAMGRYRQHTEGRFETKDPGVCREVQTLSLQHHQVRSALRTIDINKASGLDGP